MADDSGLGAARRISCSDFGFRGGSIPRRLTSSPLTGKPGCTQLIRPNKPISKTLRYLDRSLTEGVDHAPDTPGASDGKEPKPSLTWASSSLEEFEHGVRFRSVLPFGFGHDRTASFIKCPCRKKTRSLISETKP
jgi:hypothetical protein